MSQYQIFLRVLPTIWRRKPAGIDMEQNHVTVILSIRIVVAVRDNLHFGLTPGHVSTVIQCYWNNVTNVRPLTAHVKPCYTHKMAIAS